MKKVEEVIVNEEKVYLRKDFFGWHEVHPIKVDGKINWKNLIAGGNWVKLFIVLFICLVIVMAILEYSQVIKTANECLNRSRMMDKIW